MVIPLIQKNNWRIQADGNKRTGNNVGRQDEPPLSLDEQAAREILQESIRRQRNEDGEGEEEKSSSASIIPILVQNRVPDGFETDDVMDVSLRPDESTLDDYENIPIEQFGEAMLRGMGWNPEIGIGRNRKLVKPVEAVLRPKGLGLGADRRKAEQSPAVSVKEEELSLTKGSHVLIHSGSNKGLYGKVTGLDEDNARLMIDLAISQKTVTVSRFNVQLIHSKEYAKDAKVLNKDKYEKYKAKDEKRREEWNREREGKTEKHERGCDRGPEKHKNSGGDKDSNSLENDFKKSKSSQQCDDRSESPLWIRPLLRVRCVDKKYKKGRYYQGKLVVEDVVSPTCCICRTEDGLILDDINPSMLETVIPKTEESAVMIVCGSRKGQLGQIVDRDTKKYQAIVHILPDGEDVVRVCYDDICEYTGEIL